MGKRIVIIDGHPDYREERFVHALARAYQNGAETAGHEVRTISIGMTDFPMLRTSADFLKREAPQVRASSSRWVCRRCSIAGTTGRTA